MPINQYAFSRLSINDIKKFLGGVNADDLTPQDLISILMAMCDKIKEKQDKPLILGPG